MDLLALWLSYNLQSVFSVLNKYEHIAYKQYLCESLTCSDVAYVLFLKLFITRGKNVEALQKVLHSAPLASKNQAVKVSFDVLLYCCLLLNDFFFRMSH